MTFDFSVLYKYSYLLTLQPIVLWCCWLGGRKGIRPVKNWVLGCWHSYLSGARCRLAYGLFWYRLTWVVPDKGPLNGRVTYVCRLSGVLYDGCNVPLSWLGAAWCSRRSTLDHNSRPVSANDVLLQNAGAKQRWIWTYVSNCRLQDAQRCIPFVCMSFCV